jgi:hypothetical protein
VCRFCIYLPHSNVPSFFFDPLLSSPLLPLPYLQIEGDEGGYDEEYPLEGLDINTNDFMAKVSVGDFRRNWEEVSKVH